MQVLDDVLVGRGVMLLDRLGVDFVGDELDDSLVAELLHQTLIGQLREGRQHEYGAGTGKDEKGSGITHGSPLRLNKVAPVTSRCQW
jgi:hypothetical protein